MALRKTVQNVVKHEDGRPSCLMFYCVLKESGVGVYRDGLWMYHRVRRGGKGLKPGSLDGPRSKSCLASCGN